MNIIFDSKIISFESYGENLDEKKNQTLKTKLGRKKNCKKSNFCEK